jgi:hypothetical protein
MKKIIDLKLARDLRASINAQILQLESITDELARCDIRHNQEDQLSDAQLINDHVERATEALARADALLATYIPVRLIFGSPPAPVAWLMRQLQRIRERA